MPRIGVLGGSFNPVHWGHLHVALLSREAAMLDRVVFLPAAVPPHKQPWDLAPPADRRAMLEQALAAEPRTELSDLELAPGGPRYTVESLDRLRDMHPDWELSFILGMDSLAELSTWREPERLVATYRVIAVNRPGTSVPARDPRWGDRITSVSGNPFAISSSAIRDRVARGLSIRHLVPDEVAAYIAQHRLYRPDSQ